MVALIVIGLLVVAIFIAAVIPRGQETVYERRERIGGWQPVEDKGLREALKAQREADAALDRQSEAWSKLAEAMGASLHHKMHAQKLREGSATDPCDCAWCLSKRRQDDE